MAHIVDRDCHRRGMDRGMCGCRRDEELPLLTKTYGSNPCSMNEYWGEDVIGWEKARGDKKRKGRTRNQANVSGSRMSMTCCGYQLTLR
jgi:hypothetical protein